MILSIIIPLYNSAKYFDQCINSILNQNINIEDYEIIIIDDGSTDNSVVIAERYSSKQKNIHLHLQKNQGVSVSRNNGLKCAKGKYVYFVDSDDYLALNTLKKMIQSVLYNNLEILEFDMIRSNSRSYETSNTLNITEIDLKIQTGNQYMSTRSFNDSSCVYLFKRDFILKSKIKFIEGRTKQDMIFNAEIISLARRVAYIPFDVYRYVINPNSIWTSTEPLQFKKSIDDFVFVTIKYNDLILKLENLEINTSTLRSKQQIQLYNISKRLLQSDFKYSEVSSVINELYMHKLYPLHAVKGGGIYRQYLIFLFNKKKIFFLAILLFRIFKVPFENIIVKNYRRKKENIIKTIYG